MIKKQHANPGLIEGFINLNNRSSFLLQIGNHVNFEIFRPVLEDCYKDNVSGRPAYDPVMLFKILLIETWFKLSDVKVIDEINWRIDFRLFTTGDLNSPIPDDTTLVRFRKRLNDKGVYNSLLTMLDRELNKNNLMVISGDMHAVDATLVKAKTNDKDKETGASLTSRGDGKNLFGYKVHAAMDVVTRLIKEVVVSGAKDHETNFLLIPRSSEMILADKGYDSSKNRDRLKKLGILDGIIKKKPRFKELSVEEREFNKMISCKRSTIESKFGEMKLHNGLDRARYVGIQKFTAQVILTVIAVNIKRYIKLMSK